METLIRTPGRGVPWDRLVLLFLVQLVLRRLLGVIVGSSPVAALEVENAVLRH
jgi:hypothetical protein